jgi:RNA polymerase primary sigma factor
MRQLKITCSITNRENESFDRYLQDISKEELITADEEVKIALKVRQGDQKALEKLVKANLRFVVSVAKQYQNKGLSLPDLINEGNLGLIKAAKRFDETRGFKFISYAVWWIRQSILHALAEHSRIIRLPLNRVGSLNKIKNAILTLEQEFERTPSSEEIAEKLEMPDYKIDAAYKMTHQYTWMDAPLSQDDDNKFLNVFISKDNPQTDDTLMRESLVQEIQRSLKTMAKKERDVINLYYGIGTPYELTLDEIGEKFDLTRERVRQIKEKAIKRLKHSSRSKLLKSYL